MLLLAALWLCACGGGEPKPATENERQRLSYAASVGDVQATRELLRAGVPPDEKPVDGQHALIRAVKGGHVEVVRVLLEHGASTEVSDEDTDMRPLMWAAARGDDAVLRVLLDGGAQIDAHDEWRWTALHHAAGAARRGCVAELLKRNAALEVQNRDHRSPLTLAAWRGHQSIVAMLQSAGARTSPPPIMEHSTLWIDPVRLDLGRALPGEERSAVFRAGNRGVKGPSYRRRFFPQTTYTIEPEEAEFGPGQEQQFRLTYRAPAMMIRPPELDTFAIPLIPDNQHSPKLEVQIEFIHPSEAVFESKPLAFGEVWRGIGPARKLRFRRPEGKEDVAAGPEIDVSVEPPFEAHPRTLLFTGKEVTFEIRLAPTASPGRYEQVARVRVGTETHQVPMSATVIDPPAAPKSVAGGRAPTDDEIGAATSQNQEELLALLREGVDVNRATVDGYMLLPRATGEGSRQDHFARNAYLLLQAGADPNLRGEHDAMPAAVGAAAQGTASIALVAAAGADLRVARVTGTTPLLAALAAEHSAAIPLLLPGSDLNARNQNGDTPLILAVRTGRSDLVRDLLASGANPNERGAAGRSALWEAVTVRSEVMVELLLANGAAVDGVGTPPLIAAAKSIRMTRLLLEKGADVHKQDEQRRNASYYAGPTKVRDLLEAAGARE